METSIAETACERSQVFEHKIVINTLNTLSSLFYYIYTSQDCKLYMVEY